MTFIRNEDKPNFGINLRFFYLVFLSFAALSSAGMNKAAAQDRSSSAPYLSGDTFRSYADFVIDETNIPFFPAKVTPGSTIFLKTDYLDRFFNELHPLIPCRYILITHNGDAPVPRGFDAMLDDEKLIAWFGQNVENCSHPKLHPLPIGINNKYWAQGNTAVFDEVRNNLAAYPKSIFLYMNFSLHTYYRERSFVYGLFANQPFCVSSGSKDLFAYLIDLAKSQFVLSPRGNGVDCHRTWEILYMGSIPIVRSSLLDPLLKELPAIIVNDWMEVSEAFLVQKYVEMQKCTFHMEKLYADYWFKLIDAYKEK